MQRYERMVTYFSSKITSAGGWGESPRWARGRRTFWGLAAFDSTQRQTRRWPTLVAAHVDPGAKPG